MATNNDRFWKLLIWYCVSYWGTPSCQISRRFVKRFRRYVRKGDCVHDNDDDNDNDNDNDDNDDNDNAGMDWVLGSHVMGPIKSMWTICFGRFALANTHLKVQNQEQLVHLGRVSSEGVGDIKRTEMSQCPFQHNLEEIMKAVSYTHLTLPTTSRV